jgi:hypothetical protein
MSHYALVRRALLVSAAMALITVFQPTHADAAPYTYDGFATGPGGYLVGDDSTGVNVLGGQNPADPFYSGGWIQSGGDAQAVFNVGSLSYLGLPTTGGLVTDSVQFSCCSFGRDGRQLATTLGTDPAPETIYQSFLIDFGSQGTDDPTQFGFRGYEMWNGGVGDSFKTLSLFVNHFAGVDQLTLGITTPSGVDDEALVSGGGLTLAALAGVHLMVLRFDFDPILPDVVSLYLDPTTSNEASWIAAAVVSAANSDLFISHHGAITNFTFSGGGHIPGRFDEVRWGGTFEDVTPFRGDPTAVPEPTSIGLMGMGLLGALARRRRAARRAK